MFVFKNEDFYLDKLTQLFLPFIHLEIPPFFFLFYFLLTVLFPLCINEICLFCQQDGVSICALVAEFVGSVRELHLQAYTSF